MKIPLPRPPWFQRAFTILELLVVMAIITTLMAIIIPPMFHLIQYVRHLDK